MWLNKHQKSSKTLIIETKRCGMNCVYKKRTYPSVCSVWSLILQFNQSRMGLIQRSGTQKHSIHKIKCNVSKYHYLCLKSTWKHVNGLNNTILNKFIQIQTILAHSNTAYITIITIFHQHKFFSKNDCKGDTQLLQQNNSIMYIKVLPLYCKFPDPTYIFNASNNVIFDKL